MNPKPDLERTKFQIKHIYTQYKLHPAAEEVLRFSTAGYSFLIIFYFTAVTAAFSRWISSLLLRKYNPVSIATIIKLIMYR